MISKKYLFFISLRVITLVISQKMSASVIQDLITPMRELGEGCGYEGCPFAREGKLNVHIVPHSHGELGFTGTFDQHYTGNDEFYYKSNVNWKRILDFTISELYNRENRKFTLSDTPYLFHWWSNRDATVHRMVYELIRQGRLHIVGGGWGMPDEACPSYHALIDLFTYSLRKLNKTFGPCGRPLVAWQADVFGHSREFTNLASMLAFDGLFINPISFEDEIYRMKKKELEMLWRGSDDLGPESDMFTHKLFDGYWSPPGFCFGSLCNDSLIVTSDSLFKNVEERVNTFIDSVKNRQGYHYATSHIMVMMGKRMGYFDATMWFNNIDSLIDKVNEKSYKSGDNVHVMYSAPACYLKAVYDSSPALPIKQDDFMPIAFDRKTHLTGTFTSRPTVKYMAREGHVYLQMAKQMHVLAGLPAKDTKLYEPLSWVTGVFQDHNIITGAMRPHVKDYYTLRMYNAVQKSTVLLKKAFNKLRNSPASTTYYRCAFNVSSCRNTNALRSFVVIYNPLAWPVTMPVRIPVVRHYRHKIFNPKLQTVKAVSMKISDAVINIPHRDTIADHEIIFMAEDLPPMGYRSYYIESVKVAKHKKKRRSIIKKLRKSQKKKYLSRQTNQMKIDDESMLDTVDDEYYDDTEESSSTSAPDFANATFEETTMSSTDRPYNADFPDITEYEEKKHKELFGKFQSFTSDEGDSWRITEKTSERTKEEEENFTKHDESTKSVTEKENHKKYFDDSPARISDEEDPKRYFALSPRLITVKEDTKKYFIESPKLITEKEEDSNKDFDESPKLITEKEEDSNKDFDESPKLNTEKEEDSNKDFDESPKLITEKEEDSNKDFDKSPKLITEKEEDSNKDFDESPKLITEKEEVSKKYFEDSPTQTTEQEDTNKDFDESLKTITEEDKKMNPKPNQKQSWRLNYKLPKRITKEDYRQQFRKLNKKIKDLKQNRNKIIKRPTTAKKDESNRANQIKQKAETKNPEDIQKNQDDRKNEFFDALFISTEKYLELTDYTEKATDPASSVEAPPQKAMNAVTYEDEPQTNEGYRRLFDKPFKQSTTKTTTSTEYDPMDDPNFDEDKNYFYKVSRDKFIKNKYVKVHLDDKNQVSRVTLSNGVEVALTINLYYYASDDPDKMGRPKDKKPGAYILMPMDPAPVVIQDYVRSVVHKTYLVEEVQYSLSSWAGFVLRVYVERPVIELDWVVGPVPTGDDIGKDVFIRYATDLANAGEFYTDTNGRQTMKRVRNSRPTYQPVLNNIPSNFYPVTSKIHIEDPQKNIRFSVFNDRAQGGTSLNDGQIDLMIHRRILTDDDGIQAFLNDTEYGQGIVVRGKHIIYISKENHKPNKIFEKKLAKEIELAPQVFACQFNAYGDNSKEIWYGHNNEFKGVLKRLPAGVHVLTLQEWNDKLLLRLENYLEKTDSMKSRVKTVFIKDLFSSITINSVKETTLGGNVWLEDRMPLQWNARDRFVKNFNTFYNGKGSVEYSNEDPGDRDVANITSGITLTPQQIRTFIVTYEYYR